MDTSKRYKVVFRDKHTTDEHLVGFFETKELAQDALDKKLQGYYIKETDPQYIGHIVETDYHHFVRALISNDEWNRVIKSDACAEIFCDHLMCDAKAYYTLSRMIPKDATIIDIGCSYNAQSYLFKEHKAYIGVDPIEDFNNWHFEHFVAEGTKFYNMTGQQFIKEVLPTLELDLDKVFAICTYVPDWECQRLVRETFKNLYVYYPIR